MSPNQTTGEVNLKLCVFAYLHNAYPSFQTGIKHAICPMLMDADLPQIRQINSEKLFESDLYSFQYLFPCGKAFVNDDRT